MTDPVDLLAELVAIDSVNPGLVPGAAGESRIVAHLQQRLDASGFTTTVVPSAGHDDRPSLVAVGPGPADRPDVVLNGHLDTVGVGGMDAPFAATVDGDRMTGRGTADMKSGVAAMVVASEALAASGADAAVRPVLALVADEEDASLGSEAVIAALPSLGVTPAACIIGEPTDLAPARSVRGFALVEVSFPGRAAHSSQPEEGVDAVLRLGRFLAAVDAHARTVREKGGELLVTVVRGGSSPFVIADHASCVVERRTVAGEQAADALAEVQALLDPDWSARAELTMHREAWGLDDDGPAADLAAALADALGTRPDHEAPAWMEAALWQDVCPTLICGPSGGGLHAVDEWVDLRQVRAYADALVQVLGEWRGH